MSFLLKIHDFLKYLHVGSTYYNIGLHTNHACNILKTSGVFANRTASSTNKNENNLSS